MNGSDRRLLATLCAFAITMFVLRGTLNTEIKIGCSTEVQTGHTDPKVKSDWETKELPIMHSKLRGFRPVYVYSKAEMEPYPYPHYSQEGQDVLIEALMKANDEKIGDKNEGGSDGEKGRTAPFFVDLAANDAEILSNSLQLEKDGWEGICIEPNPQYWYRLASFRTCTIVGTFVGGSREEDGREVDVKLSAARKGGIVGEKMDNKGGADQKRNLVSLATVFAETNVPKMIDYFSLDVEGAEYLVMKDFPWDDYSFRFMTIERPQDELRILLRVHGYKLVRTISGYDETLWVSEENVKLSEEEIDGICEGLGIKKY